MDLVGIRLDAEAFIPFLIFAIPILAVVGGITAGIVKTLSEARIIENAQRERMMAIERGLDVSKLPPLPTSQRFSSEVTSGAGPRASGLLIWGLLLLFLGIALAAMFSVTEIHGDSWAIGLVPASVGLALLVSYFLIGGRPRPQG